VESASEMTKTMLEWVVLHTLTLLSVTLISAWFIIIIIIIEYHISELTRTVHAVNESKNK